MIGNQIGKRYAEAIYEVAEQKNEVKSVYDVLNSAMELYKTDVDFRNFITHPLIKENEKKETLKKIFTDSNEGVEILFYILEKGRIAQIREIVAEYVKLDYAKNQILDVEATFAVSLTEEQKEKLSKNLEKKTGKKIKLVVNVDKSLIGGGIIKIGDEVTDGSIRRQLETLTQK
ncbi:MULTISPECIES: ATP synthase F1 subunit delta [Cetobacterium]|jgi:F-type H+-transporting ATPase subunit delta|uniref:ATP synthase subunit delta n=1 Tax=Candidatus Cetobacterium colombiensis TaxID=3073100 RepID=A0ABU4W9W2_9FUSO|nr:ATP synthase F1 subunit delta [Candidatus Cetobacterium colombiensis]MDX8336317.1 ATP synthase F1 subunit delta [Candidatus Cetobacterium colombiensis]